MKRTLGKWLIILILHQMAWSQNQVQVYPDSVSGTLDYAYGVFYVPKTTAAETDFLNNGHHLNSVRLHIIESALNNSSNLNQTLAFLDNVSATIQAISNKADRVIFIIEKMPAWLSSSSDGSPAQTPGWYILNTKPPANYSDWDTMVTSLTDRILNTYGISNAYFEIWNEPDLGSWTGSQAEYFELFEHTYDAIKNVNPNIPVGGPATNHWANNINYTAPFGYISQSEGNLSLIGQVIDSTETWQKPLDFLSWHQFNLSTETHQNAIDYIETKYGILGSNAPALIVSEWNAPSAVRDTDLHPAYAIKNTITLKESSLDADVIAAWQDFSNSTIEFHSDYGLLTYGSIRKPFFNAVSLANQLTGVEVKTQTTLPLSIAASITADTLTVLMANYSPPPIVEALNHTLFQGQFNVLDLETAGYINIATNDLTNLISIYSEQSSIPNSSPLNQAINAAIPTYRFYDSIQAINHDINMHLSGYLNNYNGLVYQIDDSTNNDQFTYDSLLASGYSQSSAITTIQGQQTIEGTPLSLTAGAFSLSLKPNAIVLLKIGIPELIGLTNFNSEANELQYYPNPVNEVLTIRSKPGQLGQINIYDLSGKCILANYSSKKNTEIDLSGYAPGIYLVKVANQTPFKIIK